MPPKGFKLRWDMIREVNTRNGPRTLWKAYSSPLIQAAYNAGQSSKLYDLGYSRDQYDGGINFWEPTGYDSATARAPIIEIMRAIIKRNRQTRGPRIDQAKVLRERREAAVAGIRRIISERSWAIHHDFVEAARRYNDFLDDSDLPAVELLIQRTDKTVERAEKKLQAEAPADLRAFCEAPVIRQTITQALRHITGNDTDWATNKNEIGWSKATTVVGHVLSLTDELTPDMAAHGMKILKVHHRQVPEDFRGVLGIR